VSRGQQASIPARLHTQGRWYVCLHSPNIESFSMVDCCCKSINNIKGDRYQNKAWCKEDLKGMLQPMNWQHEFAYTRPQEIKIHNIHTRRRWSSQSDGIWHKYTFKVLHARELSKANMRKKRATLLSAETGGNHMQHTVRSRQGARIYIHVRSQAFHKQSGRDLIGLQVVELTGNTSRKPDQENNNITTKIKYAPNIPTNTTRLNK